MSYFFTKVPTQWSPTTLYEIAEGVFLKPATRTAYSNYPGHGSTMYFDTMFFITPVTTQEEHIASLRNWLLYQGLIFNDRHICHFFESGLLQECHQVSSLEEIHENGKQNVNGRDFDNIADAIYFLYTPSERMSYRNLFLQYEALPENKRSLITAFMLTIETAKSFLLQYSLFHDIRKYWQVVDYAGILEAIIGHSPNCTISEVKACCIECRKELQSHRAGSEKQWRKKYLSSLPMSKNLQKQYLTVINAAYDEIRHKTAHPSTMPMPQYPVIIGTEAYDIERSINDFSTDAHALNSLVWLIRDVTRYLLLYHAFGLAFFPHLETMKAVHIGQGD